MPPLSLKQHSLMLVGWGGNNGSTVTAGILANKLYVVVLVWGGGGGEPLTVAGEILSRPLPR
jgi:hypothetical protein